jgi:glycosyltransferase involved in cell wall biosynthesis
MRESRAVRVLTIGPAPSGPDSRGGMASVLTLMVAHPDPRVSVRVVPTYADRSLPGRVSIGLRGMTWSTLLVLAGRVDVLHVHLAHGGSVVRKSLPLLAARLRGTATVVHEHSYDFADQWLVLATQHVDEFATRLHMSPGRLRVLHNPVVLPGADAMARPTAPDGLVTAVGLGRLGHRKGSYDVVAAVATLPPDVRSRLRVVLAGDGEVDQVRQAVAAAEVADVVEVRGWQGPAERDELMRGAQVFVLPSHEEGLPMAMLEAMAHGLAPVVSPVGGIPNVIGDGVEGLLVQAGDVESLGKALRLLVEDEDLRTRVAAAAKARSGDFDVARWYDELTELWIDLAGRRRPARRRR